MQLDLLMIQQAKQKRKESPLLSTCRRGLRFDSSMPRYNPTAHLHQDRFTREEEELPAADLIEKWANEQRADKTDNCKRQHVETDLTLIEVVVVGKNIWILIVNKVKEESLSEDKHKCYNELPSLPTHRHPDYLQNLFAVVSNCLLIFHTPLHLHSLRSTLP